MIESRYQTLFQSHGLRSTQKITNKTKKGKRSPL